MLLLLAPAVHAENIAGNSATIAYNTVNQNNTEYYFIKRLAIKRILEKYHSPLLDSTDSFIQACMEHDLDCYLLPSISGLESTFGQFVASNSHNPFGWDGGYMRFDSWDKGINTVAQGLKQNYINKGATTLAQIGRIYSESPTWTPRVQFFMNQFTAEEQNLQLILGEKQVQL